MQIRLTKQTAQRPGITTFIRADGTVTWQKSSAFFALHDLIHYAVETTLGYRNAFLGLVAQGRDIDSFGTKNDVKDSYTLEEIWAEAIVGICTWPDVTGDSQMEDGDLLAVLMKSLADKESAPPLLTEDQLSEIRRRVRELHGRWNRVPEGGTLELMF